MYTFSHFSCFASCAVKIYYIVHDMHDMKHVYIKSNIHCILVLLMNVAGVGFILLFENTDIDISEHDTHIHVHIKYILKERRLCYCDGEKSILLDIFIILLSDNCYNTSCYVFYCNIHCSRIGIHVMSHDRV